MSVTALFGFSVRLAREGPSEGSEGEGNVKGEGDFPALAQIEAASFPEDEMASEGLRYLVMKPSERTCLSQKQCE
jgi:hypothetical protein